MADYLRILVDLFYLLHCTAIRMVNRDPKALFGLIL